MKLFPYILCFFCLSLLAGPVEKLTLSSNGHPIVQVKLQDINGGVRISQFILDTGSSTTVIDEKLSADFTISQEGCGSITGIRDKEIQAQNVQIRHITIAGKEIKNLPAIKINLTDTIGAGIDEPVDGIIGMNALDGMIFILDFEHQYVEWNPIKFENLYMRPIRYSSTKLPILDVTISKKSIGLICDTGSTGLIDIPVRLLKGLKFSKHNLTSLSIGIDGKPIRDEEKVLDDIVLAGMKGWSKPVITALSDGDEPIIGLSGFGERVLFDFIDNKIGVTVGKNGELSMLVPRRCPIAAMWQRNNGRNDLIVVAIKPHSPYENAGIMPGDIIRRVNDLEGSSLTIRSLCEQVSQNPNNVIIISRNNKIIKFDTNNSEPK